MRILRTMLVALIGLSLALAPLNAAFADSAKTTMHCDKADMDHGGSDDTCCDDQSCSTACAAKCLQLTGLVPDIAAAITHRADPLPLNTTAEMAARSWPPPAPPPRL